MPYGFKEFMRDVKQDFLAEIPYEERLEGIPEEKLLERIPPERRLQGLTREEIERLIRSLQQSPSGEAPT